MTKLERGAETPNRERTGEASEQVPALNAGEASKVPPARSREAVAELRWGSTSYRYAALRVQASPAGSFAWPREEHGHRKKIEIWFPRTGINSAMGMNETHV